MGLKYVFWLSSKLQRLSRYLKGFLKVVLHLLPIGTLTLIHLKPCLNGLGLKLGLGLGYSFGFGFAKIKWGFNCHLPHVAPHWRHNFRLDNWTEVLDLIETNSRLEGQCGKIFNWRPKWESVNTLRSQRVINPKSFTMTYVEVFKTWNWEGIWKSKAPLNVVYFCLDGSCELFLLLTILRMGQIFDWVMLQKDWVECQSSPFELCNSQGALGSDVHVWCVMGYAVSSWRVFYLLDLIESQ